MTKNDYIKAINERYSYLKDIDDDHLSECVGTIRTTLELAVKLFWLQEIFKSFDAEDNFKKFTLYNALGDERFKKRFNNFIYSDMQTIRKVCNSAVHDGSPVPNIEIKNMIGRLFNCIKEIERELGLEIICSTKPTSSISAPQSQSKVSQILKDKLASYGGFALMPVLKGVPVPFRFSSCEDGVISNGLRGVVLRWEIFDAIVEKAISLGGKMYRGDSAAHSGARIGSEELSLDTIDGFISTKFYGAHIGDTTLRRSTYYAGILDWAGIAVNHRSQGHGGFIIINPEYMSMV